MNMSVEVPELDVDYSKMMSCSLNKNNKTTTTEKGRTSGQDRTKDTLSGGPVVDIPPHLIDTAPSFVGDLIRWILETSLYPQPILALAAAIPCAGNVMAHKDTRGDQSTHKLLYIRDS